MHNFIKECGSFFKNKKVITTIVLVIIALIIGTILMISKNYLKNKEIMEVSQQSDLIIENNNETNENNENNENNQIQDSNELIDISNANEVNEEETKKEEAKNNKKETEKSPTYYIKINNRANRVNVYAKDSKGEYTKLVRGMICSTGECTPPCSMYPKTKYTVKSTRYKWAKFHSVYVRYPTQIVGGIFFHSVPYLTESKDGLGYGMFDRLGTSASAGCIRLQVVDAKWIYDNIQSGTIVEFNTNVTNSATAPKISQNVRCRNWDPTDSDPSNPWKKQDNNEEKNETKNNETIKNETTENMTTNEIDNTTKNETKNETKDNATNNETKNETKDNTTKNETKNETKDNETNNTKNDTVNNLSKSAI